VPRSRIARSDQAVWNSANDGHGNLPKSSILETAPAASQICNNYSIFYNKVNVMYLPKPSPTLRLKTHWLFA
jgi:hypothetical protein